MKHCNCAYDVVLRAQELQEDLEMTPAEKKKLLEDCERAFENFLLDEETEFNKESSNGN